MFGWKQIGLGEMRRAREAGTPVGRSYHSNLSKTLWLLRLKVVTVEAIGHAKTCPVQDFIFFPFKVFFTLAQNYFIDWRFKSLALKWSCGLPNLQTGPWILSLSLKTQVFKSQNMKGTTFFLHLPENMSFPCISEPQVASLQLDRWKKARTKAEQERLGGTISYCFRNIITPLLFCYITVIASHGWCERTYVMK